jgi:N-acetylmuramoyl-L-alanine amidase
MKSALYMLFFKYLMLRFVLITSISLGVALSLPAQNNTKKTISTVVIDPGHGGKDPGSITKRVHEKDIVLSIALKLGEYIKKNLPDVKVIYTRSTDVFIPLEQRAEIANKNQADLFISIHANKTDHPLPHGTETFAMGLSRVDQNLEVAKKENAAITYEDDYEKKYQGYDPNSAESFIIFSYVQNTYLKQSLDFANSIQREFAGTAKRANRGVKQAGFLVLWKTAMPGVLIETGFISNPDEEKFLTSASGQSQIAASIFRAFHNYKLQIESRSLYGTSKTDDADTSDKFEITNTTTDTLVADDTLQPASKSNDPQDDIEFSVQISASKTPLSTTSTFFKGLKNIETFRTSTGYKYSVGRKKKYSEITEYIKIIKNYFPDAFIIALRNGKIIPLKKALNEINN